MEKRRGLRITTWNVNGIRNPFAYEPWRRERTFAAMFEILEADIVIFQETKIQRKDLQDDMVLVPGWDVYFSLPKYKKGYSGVAIYTRNAICAPIRAEEGITGVLISPNSPMSYRDLPAELQIGGYPNYQQLSNCPIDASVIDSEGRCMILEFPAFVLIGTYCPVARDESRNEYCLGFLNALDARVRNLVHAGKKVLVAGDLNIIREEIDTAYAKQIIDKQSFSHEEFISCPARRIFNQLLIDGEVLGDRDTGRQQPVMWDICRSFHLKRDMMFTCWDQKINARPGNFGSRIDYILCSDGLKDWFCESNIQEGLMGSDHCPVYAVLKQIVFLNGKRTDIRDIMSSGVFRNGIREREWSVNDLLPLSAKLLPEFDRRRNIKDMFLRNSTGTVDIRKGGKVKKEVSSVSSTSSTLILRKNGEPASILLCEEHKEGKKRGLKRFSTVQPEDSNRTLSLKRSTRENSLKTHQKSPKSKSFLLKPNNGKKIPLKKQISLERFFETKTSDTKNYVEFSSQTTVTDTSRGKVDPLEPLAVSDACHSDDIITKPYNTPKICEELSSSISKSDSGDILKPSTSKKSWYDLMHRVPPRCDHDEPCISYVTKKVGPNFGRSFFICARPLGPSGLKEKNTEWRCGKFIWSSDWKSNK